MIPDPPGGVGRDREPAGRATTTAPTGSAGEADGGRPRARRGGGGDRDPVEKSRAARVLGNAAGRGGREGERRRPRGRSSPSRDVRGGAPRTHDGESHRPEPPPPATGGERARNTLGYLAARRPTRRGWRFPTRATRAPFPEDGRRGRKSPQTHLGRRTHRQQPQTADDAR